ncbi:SDR family NAD(P)-dependent oxidoreductase [Segniliparus rugosus]|uniref:Uncharacterized protein n=1 Tax=Segniliparus rugosus (strain ATCC BAA-974 / DSM 45345 / CCUG 50838 / CIP 108380 / JCM 13579 / CDC 945) TaxID=679197 RepID=E5XT70_SEGRC|nr:SDR family NAD(P)-dependent oxidoreductase [Segniliparus rugosus]EFV12481.1 hypothetical protein HMPREF9336_02692 [Segniliparus rugosus ATCC BAA-974]
MKDFRDKVVAITGAGSGIGRALALNFAEKGARLALSDVNFASVAETVCLAEKLGAQAKAYTLDVADRDAVIAHAAEVRADFGKVNVIVNNAGVAMGGSVEAMDWKDIDWILNINFHGVINGTKAFLPHLIESGEGQIVNISSVAGFVGAAFGSGYCTSKFGVRGFTECLRQELIAENKPVRATVVHPGGVRTNIAANPKATDDPDTARKWFHRVAATSPEGAARIIVRGIRWNSPRILVGPDAYLIDLFPRILGGRYQDILAWGTRFGLWFLTKSRFNTKRFGFDPEKFGIKMS